MARHPACIPTSAHVGTVRDPSISPQVDARRINISKPTRLVFPPNHQDRVYRICSNVEARDPQVIVPVSKRLMGMALADEYL
jgi:hypothetical protein